MSRKVAAADSSAAVSNVIKISFFVTRFARRRGWQRFAQKRRTSRGNYLILSRRVSKVRKLRLFRNWLNSFVMARASTWRSQESVYVGDEDDIGTKAKLAKLDTFLNETRETLGEDSSALYCFEAEVRMCEERSDDSSRLHLCY